MIERARRITTGLWDRLFRWLPAPVEVEPTAPPGEAPEATAPSDAATPEAAAASAALPQAETRRPALRQMLWQGRPWEAFKTFAILFSFSLNLAVVVALIVIGSWLFDLKNTIALPLVGGLHQSFVEMDDATIVRTIPVNASVPVSFSLPIEQSTVVTLTQPIVVPVTIQLPILGTTVTGNAPITLPAGTPLQIQLNTEVPVETSIPINLAVEAVIPIRETQLHAPFLRLQNLIRPYFELMVQLPPTWEDFLYGAAGSLGR